MIYTWGYTWFCVAVLFLGIYCMGRGIFIMVQVIRHKKDGDEIVKAMQLSIASVFIFSVGGYLFKNPPLEFSTVVLIGKLIATLTLVVFLHELGHLGAAKVLKVPTEEFSIGRGPILYKRKVKNTIFMFKLLPIGGYIKNNIKDLEKLSLLSNCFLSLAGIMVNLISFIFAIGVVFAQNGKSFIEGVVSASSKLPEIFHQFFIFLTNLPLNKVITPNNDLEHSVGAYISMANIVEHFWLGFALISFLLALMNLIPIPMLDGGKVVLAILESFLKVLKVPTNFINKLVYLLLLAGFAIYYAPFVINNLWAQSERIGFSLLEYTLWLLLFMSVVMNVVVYYENKYHRPIDK